MVLVIKRQERNIALASNILMPELLKKEIEEFARGVSNPNNIKEFVKQWENNSNADVEDGLVDFDDHGEEVEVVILEDEEDDDEDDDSLNGFIVRVRVEEEEEEEE